MKNQVNEKKNQMEVRKNEIIKNKNHMIKILERGGEELNEGKGLKISTNKN